MVAILKCAHLAFLCVTLVLNGQITAMNLKDDGDFDVASQRIGC